MKYGALPIDLGLIDLCPTEMMFWMYCPLAVPGGEIVFPENLLQFDDIVAAALEDYGRTDAYVYLTAKTLYVNGDYVGNRPGWHCDGFGTTDINYIWSDRCPTQFLHLDPQVELPQDCDASMEAMARLANLAYNIGPLDFQYPTFPDRHLLRLDQGVIHRSPMEVPYGMRTFIKVSMSQNRYDLLGNSINHELNLGWTLHERGRKRNHPSTDQ